jgi:hypothetical protein
MEGADFISFGDVSQKAAFDTGDSALPGPEGVQSKGKISSNPTIRHHYEYHIFQLGSPSNTLL